jgi:hypothetical protein
MTDNWKRNWWTQTWTLEEIDAAHKDAEIEDWLLDRQKARKLAREIDAAHDEALAAPPSCRVCGRPLTRQELVHLTHPIVLCWDCRGVDE